VSTPAQGGEGPRYDPYGQRGPQGGQQGGPGQQGAYGSPPPYGQPSQYAYNPYARAPYPAGPGGEAQKAVKRPGIMVVSLILLTLSALPYLLIGVVLLAVPAETAGFKLLVDSIGWPAGTSPEQQVQIIRIFGGICTAVAALYILFAGIAFTGRHWGRIVVTVFTIAFVLLAGYILISTGGGDATSLALVLTPVVVAAVGTVLLYLAASNAYFAGRRG
jgi:hypothetical protein